MNTSFHEGDTVRSATFLGTGTITTLSTDKRGRMVATVRLDRPDQNGARDGLVNTMGGNLLPAELPGYDMTFTPARGNLAWITPAIVRDVRTDPRIGPEMQERIDQALALAGQDPEDWAYAIGEMAQLGWASTIRRVAAEKGLL